MKRVAIIAHAILLALLLAPLAALQAGRDLLGVPSLGKPPHTDFQ